VVADVYDPHGTVESWLQALHLDVAIEAAAQARGAAVADFLHAFDPPGADLAVHCRMLDCAHRDIHPTLAGQTALAAAVLPVLPATLR
jgi:hypothetical protein